MTFVTITNDHYSSNERCHKEDIFYMNKRMNEIGLDVMGYPFPFYLNYTSQQ